MVECFGIIFSVPVAFGMNMAYCVLLEKVLRDWRRLCAFLYALSIVVLGVFLIEMALLGTIGIVRSRAFIGPAFYPIHLMAFFLGSPALASVLLLRPIVRD